MRRIIKIAGEEFGRHRLACQISKECWSDCTNCFMEDLERRLKMAQVTCGNCGWEGNLDELAVNYVPNPKELGDVVPEVRCPKCSSHSLIDTDDSESVIGME